MDTVEFVFNKYKYKRKIWNQHKELCGIENTIVIYMDSAQENMWDWFVSKSVPQIFYSDVSKTFSHQIPSKMSYSDVLYDFRKFFLPNVLEYILE